MIQTSTTFVLRSLTFQLTRRMSSTRFSISSAMELSSGHKMPLLGLGVYQNYGPTVTSACLAAFKAGYLHVDSAQVYRNEAEVGQAVAESGLKREDLFITTKVNSKNHGYSKTLTWLDQSLNNFRMDYVDLYLIHDPLSGGQKRLETWMALCEAKQSGKAKSIGVSNYGVDHLNEIDLAGLELPSVNQVELHPLCQQRPIVEWCREHGVAVQAYCPLIRGKHWDTPLFIELAEKYQKGIEHILIRWSLQKGYSPLPKSANPSRVISNADVYDFELSEEEMVRLDALDQGDTGAVSWNPTSAA